MPIPMQMHELDDQALAFVAGGCEDGDTDCSESDDDSDNTGKYLKIAAGTIVGGAVMGGLYKLMKGGPKNKGPAKHTTRSSTSSNPWASDYANEYSSREARLIERAQSHQRKIRKMLYNE